MIKSRKHMFIVIGVFALVMLLGTFSYAFFNCTRTGTHYWLLSSRLLTLGAGGFYVKSTGSLGSTNLNGTIGLRPVISLKLGTSIREGDGTSGSPYIIK